LYKHQLFYCVPVAKTVGHLGNNLDKIDNNQVTIYNDPAGIKTLIVKSRICKF